MIECSFDANPAILIAGKNYCANHVGYAEVNFFVKATIDLFDKLNKMNKFFVWAFGSECPKLSDLQKWHDRIPRDERPEKEWKVKGIYKESQDSYIRRIAQEYLSMKKEESHEIIERGLTQSSVTSAI